MVMILDVIRAYNEGYVKSMAGIFRGERCGSVEETNNPDLRLITLEHHPDLGKFTVHKNCLIPEAGPDRYSKFLGRAANRGNK